MALPPDEVAKLAELARLSIDSQQMESTAESVSDILSMIDQLKQIDTAQVSPLSHPMDLVQRLRADEVTETNQREELQKLAPAVESGLYLVPKVLD